MDNIKDWDEFYVELCYHIATKSKDRSTKLGVVIVGPNNEVLSIGFNGFPRGVDDNEERYHERPLKYKITEHAERNAIYNAARRGISLEGSTMYMPYDPTPCTDCTRGIIQVGIERLVGTNIPFPGKGTLWEEDMEIASELLAQSQVYREKINFKSDR